MSLAGESHAIASLQYQPRVRVHQQLAVHAAKKASRRQCIGVCKGVLGVEFFLHRVTTASGTHELSVEGSQPSSFTGQLVLEPLYQLQSHSRVELFVDTH